MKKNNLLFLSLSILILIIALTFTLLDALLPIGFLIHPVLSFLLVLFLGFGVLLFFNGVKIKSHWFLFVSNIFLSLALLYLTVTFVKWWLSILIVVVFSAILSIFTVLVCGNAQEYADNKKDGYLTYAERKNLKEEDASTQPLPEIKSFK